MKKLFSTRRRSPLGFRLTKRRNWKRMLGIKSRRRKTVRSALKDAMKDGWD